MSSPTCLSHIKNHTASHKGNISMVTIASIILYTQNNYVSNYTLYTLGADRL